MTEKFQKVSIVGRGISCNLGNRVDDIVDALLEGSCSSEAITVDVFDRPFSVQWCGIDNSDDSINQYRFDELLFSVVAHALEESGLNAETRARTGIFLGSSSFEIGPSEKSYREDLDKLGSEHAMPMQLISYGNLTRKIRRKYSLNGVDYVYGTACSASANAVLCAHRMLVANQIDAALIIGIETCNLTSLAGFHSMQLISEDKVRPFDRNRSGMILGEACAATVLTRSNTGTLSLLGGASRCDTASVTGAAADGRGISLVIEDAMTGCGLVPAEISFIKAHGTASVSNDQAEAAALATQFSVMPDVFSLKSNLGHTLGACGVLELICLDELVRRRVLPPTSGFEELDPQLGIHPTREITTLSDGGVCLMNHFGFGGNNTVLVASYD